MAKPLDALDYLAQPAKHAPAAVCVAFGDEPLLKREVTQQLRVAALGADDGRFSTTVVAGREALLRDVIDELSTIAMFGSGKRVVVIEEADEFVTRNRSALEAYVAQPRSSGVLILDAKSWPSNTKLYKALAEKGLQIECKFPSPARLLKWLTTRARHGYQVDLEPAAVELLADSVECDLGLMDQELAKLASFVGADGRITPQEVQDAVGGWRTRTAWEMLDAAASGQPASALEQLDRLLLAGEAPIAILAQIGSTLRRFAAAARIVTESEASGRRIQLRTALEQAGFKPFVIGKAEMQLRQIGRQRAANLYRWLLEADLALKGSSSSPAKARTVLEQLLVRIAAKELQQAT